MVTFRIRLIEAYFKNVLKQIVALIVMKYKLLKRNDLKQNSFKRKCLFL